MLIQLDIPIADNQGITQATVTVLADKRKKGAYLDNSALRIIAQAEREVRR